MTAYRRRRRLQQLDLFAARMETALDWVLGG
jgi:hypothetical protein